MVLQAEQLLQTRHASLRVDDKGFVISLTSRTSNKEYSPAGHPSPLLSLHEDGQPNTSLIAPASATFDKEKHEFTLKYPNGSAAVVKAEAKDGYFHFQLVSLSSRDKVDNIVWGPLNTNIKGKLGDIIGVVRDPDFAIGMYGLDDNTVTGSLAWTDSYSGQQTASIGYKAYMGDGHGWVRLHYTTTNHWTGEKTHHDHRIELTRARAEKNQPKHRPGQGRARKCR